MDKNRIIIIVLAIWCVGVTFYAVSPGSSSGTGVSAGESARLQAVIESKDKEISRLKEIIEVVDKRSRTRPVSSKEARGNFHEALDRASKEKTTGRGYTATPQW